jgi:hypothetical protein
MAKVVMIAFPPPNFIKPDRLSTLLIEAGAPGVGVVDAALIIAFLISAKLLAESF